MFCFTGIAFIATGQIYTITTVAGSGKMLGDGGKATSANLLNPSGVCTDINGNLYIADWLNDRIRKVDASGTITTIAGNGIQGFSGDGGPATAAELYGPVGVFVDAPGNTFIVDCGNQRIRKVSPTGIITTMAGNGNYAYAGDGGPATNASFKGPAQVTGDNYGNLFISDVFNHCIRKIDASGNISTITGNGSPGFSGDGGPANLAQLFYPSGVTVDYAGNIFIADAGNSCIRKIDNTGIITTVAGNHTPGFSGDDGAATAAQLYYPAEVSVDNAGDIFISDSYSSRVRMVNSSGIIFTIAGNGIEVFSGDGGFAQEASFYNPYQTFLDNKGDIFIADMFNNRIRELIPDNSNPNFDKNVVIFPSPNQGRFTISVPGLMANLQLNIYNVLGQKLFESVINSGFTLINMPQVSTGVYLYMLKNSSGSSIASGKFVIE